VRLIGLYVLYKKFNNYSSVPNKVPERVEAAGPVAVKTLLAAAERIPFPIGGITTGTPAETGTTMIVVPAVLSLSVIFPATEAVITPPINRNFLPQVGVQTVASEAIETAL
jgi:hypothetical protein